MTTNGHAPAFICRCGELNTEAAETIAALEAALVARQCTINALNAELADERKSHKHAAAARRICDYWNIVVKDGKARKPDSKERFMHVAARLTDGYSEAELRDAVDGAVYDPYVIKGKTYNDLTTIMKTAAAVDDHMSRRPSDDEMLARIWLREGPSDWFWMDHELDEARVEVGIQRHIEEVDSLRCEILAGEGPTLNYYRRRCELRALR